MPEGLQKMQYAFAAHIRNPDDNPPPADVEDRRMQIYRDLFYNNINKFLSNNFPVLRSLYSDKTWHQLVREFYSEHFCHTPLFPELPREFLRYVQDAREDRAGDPPFLLELAHYEWIELALALDENELDEVSADPEGDLLKNCPVLSPLAWPLSYRYPVHKINRKNQPTEPPPEATHLLVYRNRDDQIKFMQLNEVTQLLLKIVREEQELNGEQMLQKMAELLRHPSPEKLIESGHQLLLDLRNKDIVLGCRPT
jgi:hypothetical protein